MNWNSQLMEEIKIYRKENRTATWRDVRNHFDFDCTVARLRQQYSQWRKGAAHYRKTPILIDKFNWSFLNNRWNAGTALTEYKREDWHHPKEKRDYDASGNDFRDYKLSDIDKRLLSGIDI